MAQALVVAYYDLPAGTVFTTDDGPIVDLVYRIAALLDAHAAAAVAAERAALIPLVCRDCALGVGLQPANPRLHERRWPDGWDERWRCPAAPIRARQTGTG